jgi:hypothetical protein
MATRKNRGLILLVVGGWALVLVCCSAGKPDYGLPVTLGSTPDAVRKILGKPTDRYGAPQIGENGKVTLSQTGEKIVEWYYPAGIVAFCDGDRLTAITLHTYTGYPGFAPYSGKVTNGVTLADNKQTILRRLGTPTKVENDELASGTDRDIPVVWPAESRYYWRFKDYGIEATFLNQAQNVDEEKQLIFPRDKLVSIVLEDVALLDEELSRASTSHDYLFSWSRPMRFPINLPITQSATCRFKKSLGVGFQKPDAESRRPQGISYSAHDEDETDTVTFIDLDTPRPTVRSNGGQDTLRVLSTDKETTSLVHTTVDGTAVEMYTIFRAEGVVIHSTQQRSPLIGPFGVIEMGCCD